MQQGNFCAQLLYSCLLWGVSGTSLGFILVHRHNTPAQFGVFLEQLGNCFCALGSLCSVMRYPRSIWGVSETSWKFFLCGCFWNILEAIIMRFRVFQGLLGRQFCASHARYSGSLWSVSGTSWGAMLCTCVVLLLTLDVSGTSCEATFVHKRNNMVLFLFLEHLGNHFYVHRCSSRVCF